MCGLIGILSCDVGKISVYDQIVIENLIKLSWK